MADPVKFRLDPDTRQRIDDFAHDHGLTRSAALRILIERGFAHGESVGRHANTSLPPGLIEHLPLLLRHIIGTGIVVRDLAQHKDLAMLPSPDQVKADAGRVIDAIMREWEAV